MRITQIYLYWLFIVSACQGWPEVLLGHVDMHRESSTSSHTFSALLLTCLQLLLFFDPELPCLNPLLYLQGHLLPFKSSLNSLCGMMIQLSCSCRNSHLSVIGVLIFLIFFNNWDSHSFRLRFITSACAPVFGKERKKYIVESLNFTYHQTVLVC